ncbi:hypothetical protein SISNIDRAFT_484349 [Sistotremastrum niveocremeum HHB9708]|uniref:non-specific serine/threonine protein kinase n=1 Tax=Sistotremastrum niveocremeum HHB9708 TaxID=1314777 RepID=A0A164W802_9AGAM|nr:hypothetical protein SISNIDRAFT_484349 [Sistotremastrum niveocremeum HHB9708]
MSFYSSSATSAMLAQTDPPRLSSATQVYMRPSIDDEVERLDRYTLGGYYPVSIGESIGEGRYKILNKLGHGGTSTAWLAHDLSVTNDLRAFVTLKIMIADLSAVPFTAMPDLYIPQKIRTFAAHTNHSSRESIYAARNHF